MKALSIRWPYVEDILLGTKKIEYRSWPTKYRGDLVICSSQTPEWEHSGHAVCIVELYKVTQGEDGYYRWHLRKIRPIKPFYVKGRLGLYEVEVPRKGGRNGSHR